MLLPCQPWEENTHGAPPLPAKQRCLWPLACPTFQAEIEEGVVLEWDRRYLAVLGVAGQRLYEFRLQASNDTYERDADRLLTIATSFRCRDA